MKKIFIILTTFLIFENLLWARVRHLEVKKDQIVQVNTTIGVATIIQVPDAPQSVVLGDMEAFKVEYLDKAITIKPLYQGARSNLYVYTDWGRFNVELIAREYDHADYVVYLKNSKKVDPATANVYRDPMKWTEFQKTLPLRGFELKTKRVGQGRDGNLALEFILTGKMKEEVNPEWFWITQNNKNVVIQGLFLSKVTFDGDGLIKGSLQLLKKDLDAQFDLNLEMRRKGTATLVIPKRILWTK